MMPQPITGVHSGLTGRLDAAFVGCGTGKSDVDEAESTVRRGMLADWTQQAVHCAQDLANQVVTTGSKNDIAIGGQSAMMPALADSSSCSEIGRLSGGLVAR